MGSRDRRLPSKRVEPGTHHPSKVSIDDVAHHLLPSYLHLPCRLCRPLSARRRILHFFSILATHSFLSFSKSSDRPSIFNLATLAIDMKFTTTLFAAGAVIVSVYSAPVRRAVDPNLVPDFGITAGTNPTGTGDCDGTTGADGKPILVPCACPPERNSFIDVRDVSSM